MSSPTKTDWAYVAGIMDGEGSFSITRTTIVSAKGNPYPAYDLKVMASNTSEVLIKWLKEKFGGTYRLSVKHISKKARENGQVSMKPCYRWIVESARKQELFLLAILPYLVIKRAQALTALSYLRLDRRHDQGMRDALHLRMKALNKGESPTTNTPNADPEICVVQTDGPYPFLGSPKIESDLHGDMQSASLVTETA